MGRHFFDFCTPVPSNFSYPQEKHQSMQCLAMRSRERARAYPGACWEQMAALEEPQAPPTRPPIPGTVLRKAAGEKLTKQTLRGWGLASPWQVLPEAEAVLCSVSPHDLNACWQQVMGPRYLEQVSSRLLWYQVVSMWALE